MTALQLKGNCQCGAVTVEVNLTAAPGSYTPRACDCDYCRKHDAAYISDPDGSVVIRTSHISNLRFEQQGDNLAEFLVCAACDQLLGVRWKDRGAINVNILADVDSFGSAVSVSPKKLSAEQKVARWGEVWFSNFSSVADR